jgi:anaerobic ribonucleoside-triphosphate reductase
MIQMPDRSIVMVQDAPRMQMEDPKDPKNGDSDDLALEGQLAGGHIITYGDMEASAQKFAKSMLEVWMNGDKDGRPFHFPKCDLHVDKNSFEDPAQMDVIRLAVKVAAKNGSTYFMFDRGDGAVLAQCCRLKEKIEDPRLLKYTETLRFTGFQNVTVNLAQASYKGKNFEGTLKELTRAMELALKAHHQKAKFMKQLLETDGSPMRNLGKNSDDGTPYVDLRKSTYIIGVCGLNEAVQVITGKQLHETEDAYRTGLSLIAHMYAKTQEFKDKTGLKFVIEETPAESTTRRFAKVDWNHKIWGEAARKVVKGTKENPYYTNSIHAAPDADISMIDRLEMQSRFHEPFIQAGAIIHDYLGEQRPEWQTILSIVKNTAERTNCSQLVFSPTFTECGECGNVMSGEKELCLSPQ